VLTYVDLPVPSSGGFESKGSPVTGLVGWMKVLFWTWEKAREVKAFKPPRLWRGSWSQKGGHRSDRVFAIVDFQLKDAHTISDGKMICQVVKLRSKLRGLWRASLGLSIAGSLAIENDVYRTIASTIIMQICYRIKCVTTTFPPSLMRFKCCVAQPECLDSSWALDSVRLANGFKVL
jgi:hypothetical protein